jgi:hypothetical protein
MTHGLWLSSAGTEPDKGIDFPPSRDAKACWESLLGIPGDATASESHVGCACDAHAVRCVVVSVTTLITYVAVPVAASGARRDLGRPGPQDACNAEVVSFTQRVACVYTSQREELT